MQEEALLQDQSIASKNKASSGMSSEALKKDTSQSPEQILETNLMTGDLKSPTFPRTTSVGIEALSTEAVNSQIGHAIPEADARGHIYEDAQISAKGGHIDSGEAALARHCDVSGTETVASSESNNLLVEAGAHFEVQRLRSTQGEDVPVCGGGFLPEGWGGHRFFVEDEVLERAACVVMREYKWDFLPTLVARESCLQVHCI